jgi:hypothetical protein
MMLHRMKTSSVRRRRWAPLLLGWAALLLPSCGGGGGGHSPTEPPAAVVSFTADGAATARSFSLRRGAGTSGTHHQLELVATEVTNVASLDFVLTLPPNVVRFESARQGSFLAQNGAAPILFALPLPAPFNGVLISDNRPNNLAGASGSGVVLILEFEALANGSGRIDIEEPEANDPQNRPIGGLSWIGGTVNVQR